MHEFLLNLSEAYFAHDSNTHNFCKSSSLGWPIVSPAEPPAQVAALSCIYAGLSPPVPGLCAAAFIFF